MAKKVSNWSVIEDYLSDNVGLAFGLGILVGSFLRYFVIYPDYDRALVYSLIGIIIILLSWVYSKRFKNEK
jgi:hypothetical protein